MINFKVKDNNKAANIGFKMCQLHSFIGTSSVIIITLDVFINI